MKELLKTKVTVRLRKAEFRKEWFIYLESYPVIVPGKEKAQRVREYLNRSVTTVDFDKKRPARTKQDSVSYKPKRDDNGIIICKSENDRETMIYADSLRKLRQREYDNIELYSELDAIKAEEKEKSQQDFVKYFDLLVTKRHKNSSESIQINWYRSIKFLKDFGGEKITFSQINTKFCEKFKSYLLTAKNGNNNENTISQNTASTYFSVFKAALKEAFIDGYFTSDISAKVKSIPHKESRREYLTLEELNTLVETPCELDVLKRAALFSALTGLRHSDIQKLTWDEISIENEQAKINFTQKKTKGVEYMPISKQALQLCGEVGLPTDLIFKNLTNPAWISRPLKKWIESAGITKKITFHNFRHTFATLQLSSGTDIYTVSKMLGHTNVKTTQVYAKVVDEKKNKASQAIHLKNLQK
ncbi:MULTISPECIES: site-specific integrase [Weeksellaceae]|uniref:site-specific integrase n=1 Tax=Weeksellaceae TaxID=2762318 RepID=UPI001EE74AA0|nr:MULTISPECIES: site-specific integrase [Weeksellaceae]MCT4033107.1 site-specific integrase [Elizabethkingia anophelis]MCT4198844.1 site-specific integrase [Elizabethkingia anophelis]MCT4227087.1 site-specific integrase [Elizabethkingia anophelis]MCT4309504.1 site-specific integrase [Elizabethkingia anophelis]MDV4116572.1 recombinase [Elizabethkingia anophelis]